MKLFAPNYYKDFACIAGACRHSCCLGWEIDVDDESLEFYNSVPGEFGRRLDESIEVTEEGACFKLGCDERCPFLNKDNLCDIIINLGEESLCQICADHPRFRNFYSDRTEVGLGLCCEAAAELVLGNEAQFELCEIGEEQGEPEPLTPEEEEFFDLRSQAFAALKNREKPIFARADEALALCGGALPQKTNAEWAEIYFGLERLDTEWDEYLKLLSTAEEAAESFEHGELEKPFEQLLCYFFFRHFSPDRPAESAAFAVLSFKIIRSILAAMAAAGARPCLAKLCEIARLYSSEIEYSEENLDAIFEELY